MTTNEALAYMVLWRRAARTQSDRLLNDPSSGPSAVLGRQVDASLFALALRQVLRAAQLVRRGAPRAQWSPIDRAINEFNEAAPDVVTVRDVLDHFDEYAAGKGKLQERPGAMPLNWFVAREATTVKLLLSIRPSQALTIDVLEATGAMERLCDLLADALAADDQ